MKLVGWLNDGRHEHLMLGQGLVRYLSAIVHMELSVGARRLPARRALSQLVRAYRSVDRLAVPDADVFSRAGEVLQRLRDSGRELRKASLVNDVLISLSARSIGATVLTSAGTSRPLEVSSTFDFAWFRRRRWPWAARGSAAPTTPTI
jgi:predicted nucleic acid-binding protein